MTAGTENFELPGKVDKYFAVLSKHYEVLGERQLREIIVNCRIRLKTEWNYEGWGDGQVCGHALFLELPESLYSGVIRNTETLSERIKNDFNQIKREQNEYIEKVFIELEDAYRENWREKSGLLRKQRPKKVLSLESLKSTWEPDQFRLFLSHKAEHKTEAGYLKTWLGKLGISAFVAHEDIQPTKEWQEEIENALVSMEALVALLSEDFHDSNWTDQEIGVAIGRGVPIIPIRLGLDPYGFIGKYQAVRSCNWNDIENIALALFKVLVNEDSCKKLL